MMIKDARDMYIFVRSFTVLISSIFDSKVKKIKVVVAYPINNEYIQINYLLKNLIF